jgi:NhaA family Na+:H+ antiporter
MSQTPRIRQKKRAFPRILGGERAFLADTLRAETTGGLLLLAAAVVALAWSNSPWQDAYHHLREARLGPLTLEAWASDGALTLFFYLAGVELKRELVVGTLSKLSEAVVPVVAALSGMVLPAIIYLVVNLSSDRGRPAGWAVPMATDIAFALAVLAIVGSSLPSALRAFLLTLAVVDDFGAILAASGRRSSTCRSRWRRGGSCTSPGSTRRSPGSRSGWSPGWSRIPVRSTRRPSGSSTGSGRGPRVSPYRCSRCSRPGSP